MIDGIFMIHIILGWLMGPPHLWSRNNSSRCRRQQLRWLNHNIELPMAPPTVVTVAIMMVLVDTPADVSPLPEGSPMHSPFSNS